MFKIFSSSRSKSSNFILCQMKKFSQYEKLEIKPNIQNKYEIILNGKKLKTPSKNPLSR